MKPKTNLILFSSLILTVGYLSHVHAVTDAELEALEKQIEQLETEEKIQAESAKKKRVEEEAKRKAEQKRKANAEADRKRLAELEKQRKEEEELLAKELKKREEEEKKKKYTRLITEAGQAVIDKDKELAISKYNEALILYPDDLGANIGLRNAENLKHKLCYDVLGKWIWDKAFGQEYIVLLEDGSIDYQISIKGSGSWECTDPENRTIKIRLTAVGFSNEWLSTYSADGSCLLGPETWGERGCYHRPESGKKSEKIELQEQTKDILVNSCSTIIGVWRWNDLSRTTTSFYKDGKVVSKKILKSEGTWECIEPKNRIFTYNTWGKKRKIKMSDDANQLESTNAFTGLKLIGIKISDNPLEKIAPAKKSTTLTPGL